MLLRIPALALVVAFVTIDLRAATPTPTDIDLDRRFSATVQPFLKAYCIQCHSGEMPKADLDLQPFSSLATVVKDPIRWELVRERLGAKEMPPATAKDKPTAEARQQILDWIDAARRNEAQKNAGDPGTVLARRLSNAEYNYTIRDLTKVDLQPTREFPVDPSNTAGFDNSGESLVMSPALLDKYLKAADEVADHMYLKPKGFAFSPYQMLVETDRDKFCVNQIVAFYDRQNTDYADYFQAAWRFKNRAALGKPNATLSSIATESKVSPKYLATIWSLLEDVKDEVGPPAKLQSMWNQLPAPRADQVDVARTGCEQMRDYVIQLRAKVERRFLNIAAGRLQSNSVPLLLWRNRQYAMHRMTFDPAQLQVQGEPERVPQEVEEPGATVNFGPGRTVLINNTPGDPDLAVPEGQRARYEAAFAKFCAVFPDRFYTRERGLNYFNIGRDRDRLLSAGFHNRMGYFRDDLPLYELILDKSQQDELDSMWRDFDFIASVTARTFRQSYDGARNTDAILELQGDKGTQILESTRTSEANIKRVTQSVLTQAEGGDAVAIKAVEDYFKLVNETIRWTEKARADAEPTHLEALVEFAARAYRRPLTKDERDNVLAYYRTAREKDNLTHESAVRDSIVYVLMSPDLSYRIDLVEGEKGIHPLSDYDLASRLSYFLWSSMPDEELLSHAAKGDLHEPKVIAAQASRMLKDPRVRGLAVEFGGNWLDFRHFEQLNSVDRQRFNAFTDELRGAMFEEPIRLMLDVFQKNRSILDLLYANDTFVNPALAKHYGMPELTGGPNDWVHIKDASKYERGGLLPMGAFLTKNAPGLRTSPVKRGNWIVKNVLGEKIAPPPVGVPEIPQDEAKLDLPLPQMLAKHREDPNCATCHARFDSLGLAFEGFGPVGERRDKDLAGRVVDDKATFPGGSEGEGIEGVRKYIKEHRQNDYVKNFSAKLLAYALGRSLMLSDDILIEQMHTRLSADGYRFETMIESIVTSPQFLNKRGRDSAER